MRNRIIKWVLLICVVSFVTNGILYLGTENKDLLINTFSSAGIGVLSAIWLLFAKSSDRR